MKEFYKESDFESEFNPDNKKAILDLFNDFSELKDKHSKYFEQRLKLLWSAKLFTQNSLDWKDLDKTEKVLDFSYLENWPFPKIEFDYELYGFDFRKAFKQEEQDKMDFSYCKVVDTIILKFIRAVDWSDELSDEVVSLLISKVVSALDTESVLAKYFLEKIFEKLDNKVGDSLSKELSFQIAEKIEQSKFFVGHREQDPRKIIIDDVGASVLINKYFDSESSVERAKLLTQIDPFYLVGSPQIRWPNQNAQNIRKILLLLDIQKNGRGQGVNAEEVKKSISKMRRTLIRFEMEGTLEAHLFGSVCKAIKNKPELKKHLPRIGGNCSGRMKDTPEAVGFYSKVLEEARIVFEKKGITDPRVLEHKSFLLAREWVIKSLEFNNADRPQDSSYVGNPYEAVVWARLGSSVQKSLKGMRHKIQCVDFHNLSRFIGKSGDNKYLAKKQEYRRRLRELEEGSDERAQLLFEYNNFIKKQYNPKRSLAEMAIDLRFSLKIEAIDWLNDAPYGLIKWCSRALDRGVSIGTVTKYALSVYIFNEWNPDEDMLAEIENVNSLHATKSIRKIQKFNNERGLVYPNKDYCRIGAQGDNYIQLRVEGYSHQDIIQYPWLMNCVSDINFENKNKSGVLFSSTMHKGAQQAWLRSCAYYVPKDWSDKVIGQIMHNRLISGIDKNIHDASFWFQNFETPNENDGVVYKNIQTEKDLIRSLMCVPDKFRARLPANENRYNELFSSDATAYLYGRLVKIAVARDVTMADIDDVISEVLEKIKSKEIDLEKQTVEFRTALIETYNKLKAENTTAIGPISSIIEELKQTAERRKKYVIDTQSWVSNHQGTGRNLLVKAWNFRDMAIKGGAADNPRAIIQWVGQRGVFELLESMKESYPEKNLPAIFSELQVWMAELVRHYSPNVTVDTILAFKERFNPDYVIAPCVINLGDGWSGEIFEKSDPRGATIGADTGCCMTLSGASSDCIDAGYRYPDCGFFGLYRNGALVAQSFLYANLQEDKSVIVCDNIEASSGKDREMILDKYKAFFQDYLEQQLTRNECSSQFTKVNIGTGYTEIGLGSLKSAESVPVGHSIYTDAAKQKRLLVIDESVIQENKKNQLSIVSDSKELFQIFKSEVTDTMFGTVLSNQGVLEVGVLAKIIGNTAYIVESLNSHGGGDNHQNIDNLFWKFEKELNRRNVTEINFGNQTKLQELYAKIVGKKIDVITAPRDFRPVISMSGARVYEREKLAAAYEIQSLDEEAKNQIRILSTYHVEDDDEDYEGEGHTSNDIDDYLSECGDLFWSDSKDISFAVKNIAESSALVVSYVLASYVRMNLDDPNKRLYVHNISGDFSSNEDAQKLGEYVATELLERVYSAQSAGIRIDKDEKTFISILKRVKDNDKKFSDIRIDVENREDSE